MKRITKPADAEAANITFGVEIETKLPRTAQVAVGGYHSGLPVRSGRSKSHQGTILAPTFHGIPWRADRDSSIQCLPEEMACEFVSPILRGTDGLINLRDFVAWVNEIGATVDASCGLHITVGVESIIGTLDAGKVSEFARKIAHIAQWHAMSLYGQTGTGRHLNRYSGTFSSDVARHMRTIVRTSDVFDRTAAAAACGRGMVNFGKVFSHGVIEFRVCSPPSPEKREGSARSSINGSPTPACDRHATSPIVVSQFPIVVSQFPIVVSQFPIVVSQFTIVFSQFTIVFSQFTIGVSLSLTGAFLFLNGARWRAWRGCYAG